MTTSSLHEPARNFEHVSLMPLQVEVHNLQLGSKLVEEADQYIKQLVPMPQLIMDLRMQVSMTVMASVDFQQRP
jgi:hypothetical protein